jgi:predicted DsbA family dithiol-disulfide isomerase
MSLRIDVISDVICPWCYIGKRRLERALRSLAGTEPVEVHWLPFELNPHMPPEGLERRVYRTKKFGSWERSQELDAQVAAAGAAEGLVFNHDRMTRTPNTFQAHRLIWRAGQLGQEDAVVETLFRGYFTEGRNFGDPRILLDLAVEAGLERQQTEDWLKSDQGKREVQAAELEAQQLGVQTVPFFIINHRLALSGAQEVQQFLEAFQEVGNTRKAARESKATCVLEPGSKTPSC